MNKTTTKNLIDLRKNGVSVEEKMPSIDAVKKEKYKMISQIISGVSKEFQEEVIQALDLSTYALSRLSENPHFTGAVKSSIENVIKEYAIESRLFRRIWKTIQFRVSGNDIKDESLIFENLDDLLGPGLYEITYLEPKFESAEYSKSLEYFKKSGAIFLGIHLLRILQEHPEWIEDDSRAITTLDHKSSYYLLKGEIYPSSVAKHGVKEHDILVHFVKLS
jgi:hypothetical protein